MSERECHADAGPPGLELRAGARVCFNGRLWKISRSAKDEIELSRRVPSGSLLGSETTDECLVVPADEFVETFERSEAGLWIDDETRKQLSWVHPKDVVRWRARLAIINIIETGYRWGYPLSDMTPDVPEIAANPPAPVGDRPGAMPITAACRLVADWLATSNQRTARELVHDLNSRSRRQAGTAEVLSFKAPGYLTLWRAQKQLHDEQDIWSLDDGRAQTGPRGTRRSTRRTNAEALVRDFFDGRTDADSSVRDVTIINEIKARASELGREIPSETVLREVVKAHHDRHGRTPQRVATNQGNARREERGSAASTVPGHTIAWDETPTDIMVVRKHGSVPFRARVNVAVEMATGLIMSIYATGRYNAENVLLLAYDAFRPIVYLPTEDGLVPRFKPRPSEILISAAAERELLNLPLDDDGRGVIFKPGAVPAFVRADNARPNWALPVLFAMRRLGVSLAPSQVGVKTNNHLAENVLGNLATFLESLPVYVGHNTVGRGSRPDREQTPLLIEELNLILQEQFMLAHNAGRCMAPAFKGTGLSRLEAWDQMIETFGEPAMLTDPRDWFQFLPRREVKLTSKGLNVDGSRFDDRTLRRVVPPRLLDDRDRITVIFDPRRHERLWVPDDREKVLHPVDNVLRDYTDAPMVRTLRLEAMSRARLRDTSSVRQMTALGRYMESLVDGPGEILAIERDLADWHLSGRVSAEVNRRLPADFIQAADKNHDPPPTASSPDNTVRFLPLPEHRR